MCQPCGHREAKGIGECSPVNGKFCRHFADTDGFTDEEQTTPTIHRNASTLTITDIQPFSAQTRKGHMTNFFLKKRK